jgi:hypothetical protein
MKKTSVWEGGEAFVQPEESLVARVGSIISVMGRVIHAILR